MLTARQVSEIQEVRDMMAAYDDAGQRFSGKYSVASRLFEMKPDWSGPVADVEDADGNPVSGIHCLFTNDDLVVLFPKKEVGRDSNNEPIMEYSVTTDIFALAYWGSMGILRNIPPDLGDFIGMVRR